jgi:hypothetical protein
LVFFASDANRNKACCSVCALISGKSLFLNSSPKALNPECQFR